MQLASDLPVDPGVNFGGAEPPELAGADPSNSTGPCESLESFRMYLHDRSSLIRIEQRFEMQCAGDRRMAMVRAGALGRLLRRESVIGEQEGLLKHE